jgi:hypothetical protein
LFIGTAGRGGETLASLIADGRGRSFAHGAFLGGRILDRRIFLRLFCFEARL